MNNWIVGLAALLIVVFLAKKGCRPAVWLFVASTASMYIFLMDKLVSMELPWQIGASALWFVIFLLAIFVKKNHNKAAVSFLLIAVVAIGCMAFFAPKANAEVAQKVAEPVYTQTGQQTWKMEAGDYTNNRWFADGVSEIQNATTQQDAVKAATVWLDKVKTDPTLLTGATKFFLKEDVDKATLVDENGYATDKAIQLTERIALTLATSNIKVADAPTTGVNSGVENDTVVQASGGGITGNTKAIQITDATGQAIWVMARCGNPVTSGSVGVPTGTTDNPPAPNPPSPPSPPTPPDNPLEPKNPEESTLVNPAVDDWKKDETPSNTVSDGNGAEISNGYQADPVQDAADAAADAADAAAENTATHEDAVNEATNTGGGAVNDNQGKTEVVDPATTDPNW